MPLPGLMAFSGLAGAARDEPALWVRVWWAAPPCPPRSLGQTQLLFGLRCQADQELDPTCISEKAGPWKAAVWYGFLQP